MNEAEIPAELIDPALKEVGWGIVEGSRVRRVSSLLDVCKVSLKNQSKMLLITFCSTIGFQKHLYKEGNS